MNYDEIKKLIDDMGSASIDELKIEFPEGVKISMKKNSNNEVIETPKKSVIQSDSSIVPTIQVNNKNNIVKQEKKSEKNYNVIKSPMVGTFYSRPSPNKDTFVKVGDNIKKGQVICIVEAMKLMNEIESEFEGEIVEICVDDNDIVEYGTPLFKIK